MTTAPKTPRSGPRPGAAGPVVGRAALATLASGAVAALLGGLLLGPPAVAGALVGTAMVVLFFGLGALVLDTVAALAPAASLLIALLTYTLKVVLVGMVFVGLSRSGALESSIDPRWLGGTVIVATLTWLAVQVLVSVRARQPLYDLPADSPVSGGPSSRSGAEEAGKR